MQERCHPKQEHLRVGSKLLGSVHGAADVEPALPSKSSQPRTSGKEKPTAGQERHWAEASQLRGKVVVPLDGSRKDDLALQVLAVQVSASSSLLPLLVRHDGQRLDQGEEAAKGKTSKTSSVRVKALGEAVQVGEHNHLILKPEELVFQYARSR